MKRAVHPLVCVSRREERRKITDCYRRKVLELETRAVVVPVEVVVIDVENQSRLDPEKSRGELKPTRHSRSPVEEHRVDQASHRRVTVLVTFDELRQGFLAVVLEVQRPALNLFGGGKASLVEAVGESKEREVVVKVAVLRYHGAVEDGDARDESDTCAGGSDEATSEMERWVHVALSRVRYE